MTTGLGHAELREQSRQAIGGAIGDCADLVLVRAVGNYGDELIMEGTRALLSDRPYREISLDELGREAGEMVLLIGAGAFSRAYHEWAPWALRVAEERFERVIVLPSTFEFAVPQVRDVISNTGAVVFARELESFAEIRDLCDARLAFDGAFFYDFDQRGSDGSGALNVFRTDREAPEDLPLPPDNADISATAGSLTEWLQTIARHALVRTNRAHVMIAAAMLGKQVELAPCRSSKLQALAQYALRDFPVSNLEPESRSRRRLRLAPATEEPGCVGAVLHSGERLELTLRGVESVLEHPGARALILASGSPDDVRAGLEAAARDEPRVELGQGWHPGAGPEYTLLLEPDVVLAPGTLERLLRELEADPRTVAAAPAVGDGSLVHCGGDLREGAGIVEFRPAAEARRCDWAPFTALLVRTPVLAELPPDSELPVLYRAREWGYRVVRRYGASAVRLCPQARATPHHTPAAGLPDTSTFHGRCLTLPSLAAMAHFHARHDRIIRADLAEMFPALNRGRDGFDLGAARLLMRLLHGLGPGQFLALWSAGELDSVIGSEWAQAEAELERVSGRLDEIHGSRAWRLAGAYYRARQAARRLGRPRRS